MDKDAEKFAALVKQLTDAGGKAGGGLLAKQDERSSRDVLGPLRPLAYVTVPVCSASAAALVINGFWIAAILPAVMAFLVVGAYLYAYFFWSKTDPNRLQTEDYRLAERRLGLIAEKGVPQSIAAPLSELAGYSDESGALPAPQPRRQLPSTIDTDARDVSEAGDAVLPNDKEEGQ